VTVDPTGSATVLYTLANGELTSDATSKAALSGMEIIGLTNGTTYKVEEVLVGTLMSDPTAVTEGFYWGNITLSLDGDTFKGFNWNNVVFGGDFSGLIVSGSQWVSETEVILVSVNGSIVRNSGEGTITIKGAVLNGGSDLTVRIAVN